MKQHVSEIMQAESMIPTFLQTSGLELITVSEKHPLTHLYHSMRGTLSRRRVNELLAGCLRRSFFVFAHCRSAQRAGSVLGPLGTGLSHRACAPQVFCSSPFDTRTPFLNTRDAG